EELYSNAKDSNVGYVLPGVMYLRGKTRNVFFDFIEKDFPDLFEPLKNLYKKGGAGSSYKEGLYKMVNELKAKYELSGSYSKLMKEKMNRNTAKDKNTSIQQTIKFQF
ncbi:MAG: hypothetical protein LBV74_22350, partial [Tannerella sp.]|nr:hypothetical protein [Tannerella sp.]